MSAGPPNAERRRVLVVVAHPDDETFGMGSVIAAAVDAGAEVVVCCATRGEAGESAIPVPPGEELAAVRERELRAAGAVLGVHRFVLLGFGDSGMGGPAAPDSLAGAPEDAVAEAVAAVIDDVRPDLVVTIDPTLNDHRDHERIGRATLAAAARWPALPVYGWCLLREMLDQWFALLAEARPGSEYVQPPEIGRRLDEVTTVLDTSPYLDLRRRAIAAHASQTPPLTGMPAEMEEAALTRDYLVRMQPPWSGGEVERSLPV
jgi:LmbE family N-acetylglucosaminyl deacetylase